MKTWRNERVLIVMASAGLAATSWPALGQPSSDPALALAGPAVREQERPSIVRRNIYGELQRPEESPEEAAIHELRLDAGLSAAVEKVFLRRMRRIDQWVARNAGLIARLKRVSDATPVHERVVAVLDGLHAAGELTHEPTLWEQVQGALPASVAGEFDRMMAEYWDAVAADGRARPAGVLERFAIVSKERLDILGREINRAFETLGDSGHLAVTALTGGLDLSEAQRSQVAVMASDFDQTSEMPPSGEQKRALILKVLSILSPVQREKVLSLLGG